MQKKKKRCKKQLIRNFYIKEIKYKLNEKYFKIIRKL